MTSADYNSHKTLYTMPSQANYWVSFISISKKNVNYKKLQLYEISLLLLQAIREGAAKAASEVSAASSETAKAEAEIAVECYEALQKAIE